MSEINSNENNVDVEVTIKFRLNRLCWESDLEDEVEDAKIQIQEFVEDALKYEFDWSEIEYDIVDVKKIS